MVSSRLPPYSQKCAGGQGLNWRLSPHGARLAFYSSIQLDASDLLRGNWRRSQSIFPSIRVRSLCAAAHTHHFDAVLWEGVSCDGGPLALIWRDIEALPYLWLSWHALPPSLPCGGCPAWFPEKATCLCLLRACTSSSKARSRECNRSQCLISILQNKEARILGSWGWLPGLNISGHCAGPPFHA